VAYLENIFCSSIW